MDTAAVDLLPFLSVPQVAGELGRADAPLILDVRNAPAFGAASRVIPDAMILLPDDVCGTVPRLTLERGVVVYCVHGHEVSQDAAPALRDGGIHACYLEGGITAWEQTGLPTMAKLPEDIARNSACLSASLKGDEESSGIATRHGAVCPAFIRR
jgi:rhodanese-related sulfurtransferase